MQVKDEESEAFLSVEADCSGTVHGVRGVDGVTRGVHKGNTKLSLV